MISWIFNHHLTLQVSSCKFVLRNSKAGCRKAKVSSKEAVFKYPSDINIDSLLIHLIQVIYITLIIDIKICNKIIEMRT